MNLSETGRVEAFSDGVFAVAVTLLVFDLKVPDHREGQLLSELARQWPAYAGFFASFLYTAVIWLNHHTAFTRIRHVDRGLHFANLTLLFTTALIPFPTAVLSHALIDGVNSADARTAVALYAGIAAAMCAAWLLLYTTVHRGRDRLVEADIDPGTFAADRWRSIIGIVGYLSAGVVGALVYPAIALAVFVCLPIFYAATSEGALHLFGNSRRGGSTQ
ncbi:TMEM175 family protein [Rhodococcus olei]|uniref:TMEM175 family protein n=1 Tax=Rhodococcus olei TaxID=2161675 RepID=UPI0031E88FB4